MSLPPAVPSAPPAAPAASAAPERDSPAWQAIRHRRRRRHLLTAALLAAGLLLAVLAAPADLRGSLWRGAQANPVLLTLPVVFSLVALSLLWAAGQAVDSWVFIALNLRGRRPLWLDWAMLGLTQLGSAFILPPLILALWLASQTRLAYELVLGSLTLWLLVELVKALVGRSRPSVRHIQARIVGYKQPGRSFPSGHTSQIFFVITLIIQHFGLGLWPAIGLYLLALLVGITRIYVGAHYPRDVLAGAVLGTLWGLLGVIIELPRLVGLR